MTERIGGATSPVPTTPPGDDETPAFVPAGLAGPELVIAQAAMDLEDAALRNADASRASRTSQRKAQRASLDEKRKAAKLQLAAGLVNAGAQAAQGVASFASASQDLDAANASEQASQFDRDEAVLGEEHGPSDATTQRAGELASESRLEAAEHSAASKRTSAAGGLASSAGSAASSVLGHFGERASVAAEQRTIEAAEHGDAADAADEARESAQRFADKAMQHMAEIEEAKHRAAMAALRG